jgi:stearoyl-CoA desaturase (delta-9 desaturase)
MEPYPWSPEVPRRAWTARLNPVVFWVVQASALLAFFAPFSWALLAVAGLSYLLRMLGITLGFHRHFAHRAFEMSRPVRLFWAILGTAAMQKGPLWWAGNHVYHHRYADREGDPHSPRRDGFYHAHIGWFLDDVRHDQVDARNPVVRHFSRFPEIRWLDRLYALPPLALAAVLFLWGGLPLLVWGFCLPTVALAHATFAINTVNHLVGTRRFPTSDDSRNNPVTALLTLGEGWHNNHHRYQRAARNGFYWWEIDPTHWVIEVMGRLGLAWDIQQVPQRIYREAGLAMPPGPPAIEIASS